MTPDQRALLERIAAAKATDLMAPEWPFPFVAELTAIVLEQEGRIDALEEGLRTERARWRS